jgi:hypothetical protein
MHTLLNSSIPGLRELRGEIQNKITSMSIDIKKSQQSLEKEK